MEALGPTFPSPPLSTSSSQPLRLPPLSLSLNTPPPSLSPLSLSNSFIPSTPPYPLSSMAQKREKEETELKVPESLTLCTPPSIPTATSKISASDEHRSDLKTGVVVDSRSSSASSPKRPDLHQEPRLVTVESSEDDSNRLKRRKVNRCSGCHKKVGLMGFMCRCGEMFCSDHRYSDRHDCSYDYKAAGREAIARENPVVRAAKILKV